METQGKKRKSKYNHNKKKYHKSKRPKRQFVLEAGLKGFLVTCNNREREAVRESYNVLNEYAEKLYGPETLLGKEGSGSDDDIQASLEREIESIKSQPESLRRFQVVESNVNNCLFIRTTVESPSDLAQAIYTDAHTSGQAKARYMQRFVPVNLTCKASNITKVIEPLLEQHFGSESKSYCIRTRVRNNSSAEMKELLPSLVKVMQDKYSSHPVDYINPELVINLEVLCTVACVSVLTQYNKFRKYNLIETAAATRNKESGETEIKGTDEAGIKETGAEKSKGMEGEGVESKETEGDGVEGKGSGGEGVESKGETDAQIPGEGERKEKEAEARTNGKESDHENVDCVETSQ